MKVFKTIKRFLCICLIFLLKINVLAAVVSDNDGSAFITKAEFDSLKNNFQAQIDGYNNNIDSKIDNAIASYLAGISVKKYTDIRLDFNQNLGFPLYSCVGKESSKHTYKESGDIRFDLSLPQVEVQTAGIVSSNNHATNPDIGLRVFSGHNTGLSYNNKEEAIIDLVLNVYHSDPTSGNYEVAAYDTITNKWKTKGYKNGYIKVGSECKVQDLTISRGANNLTRQGIYSGWDSSGKIRHYLYANIAGSTAGNLYKTTNSTTFDKWYGNIDWKCYAANWFSVWSDVMTDAQKSFYENFTGKNLTLDDYKQSYVDAGYTYNQTSTVHVTDIPYSDVKGRIESDKERNKIYSGANAYVNAFPESNIWCYNPVKISGKWKSDEFTVTKSVNYLMHVSNYSFNHPDTGVAPYFPHWPILVPALDGDTDDVNYGKDARFSIINADKLWWTDDNGDEHKFNEGLFITKIKGDGGLKGEFKFSEASSEKVWCAFSKKPFDGSWTNDDALTIKINSVTKDKTNLLYDCGTDYTFEIDGLKANDKVYMCFKSSSGSKNPSLDYLNKLQTYSE